MNHWPFVIASYVIVLFGTACVVAFSYAGMRKAERHAEALTKKRSGTKSGT